MFRNILKTATEIVLEHQTNERWESVCTMPPPIKETNIVTLLMNIKEMQKKS